MATTPPALQITSQIIQATRRATGWLGLCLLLCLLSGIASNVLAGPLDAAAAEPEDHVTQRAFWEDRSGQASFETARQQPYTTYQYALNRSYTNSAIWVRLTIAPSSQPIALLLSPAWLDDLTLYDPASPNPPVTVGDRHPANDNALPGLGYSFSLPASPTSRDVWLRLQTTSAHRLVAHAVPMSDAPRVAMHQLIWATLYASTVLLILIVLSAVWSVQRDRVLGTYLLRMLFYAYYGSAYLGLPNFLLSDYLQPATLDLAFSLSATLMMPIGIIFDITFLSTYRPNRFWLALLKLIGALGIGVVLILLAGHVGFALHLNIYLLMLANIAVTATAFTCESTPTAEQIIPKKVMLAYYAFTFSSLLLGLVSVLGWLARFEWTIHTLTVHGLVSGLMMAAILIIRAQRQANQNRQMRWELSKMQQDFELEQQRHHEQSQFLHMLMHELKTPLSVMALALGTESNREQNLQHASRAIRDMKAIIDRCVQSDQLGRLTLDQDRQAVDVPALIRKLADDIPGLAARLHLAAAENLPDLHTDRQLLRIILSNLIENAVRYSDPATPIGVSAESTSRQGQSGISVRVSNTPGLAGWPDARKIFSKYYRASGARRESGSGLGLFLSHQLAHSLGGTLEYEPGTQQVEFVLWIPRHNA